MNKAIFMVALLSLMGNAAADQGAGKIKICRVPGLTELMDKKNIPIPIGSRFTAGFNPKDGAQLGNFIVETTAEISLPPKPGCAVVVAKAIENGEKLPLSSKSPFMVAQFNTVGATLKANVIETFK